MLTDQERKKRARETGVIAIAVILIVLLTGAEIKLSQISSTAPLSSNIVIFGMINVVVLLVVLLVYLICRNIVKLFV